MSDSHEKYAGQIGVPLSQTMKIYEELELAGRDLVKDFYERAFPKADGRQRSQMGRLYTALNNLGAVSGREIL